MTDANRNHSSWGVLTNHTHVLLCISREPSIRTRDIAETVGITERATQKIVADVLTDGYITRTTQGRRSRYTVNRSRHLRQPVFRHKLAH